MTVWVEGDGVFRPTAAWPGDVATRTMPAGRSFDDAHADHSFAVHHDDELLGGLSLVIGRGESLATPEQELVEDLVAGLGLALRNTRLTARLREQVSELEASRERVVAAADEARRDLERDLDSGPQQQLVALKVKLGPIRMRAERQNAVKTAAILEQLEAEAGSAIKAVRDFSSGVYPPLLEAEGVVTAIRQRVQNATLPIRVLESGIGRYPRDIEAAIYFSILEALQNVAKYAEPTAVVVRIDDAGAQVTFEVRDDGQGFDSSSVEAGSGLANMADRLDAVGGRLDVESTPGVVTVVSGKVPMPEMAPA